MASSADSCGESSSSSREASPCCTSSTTATTPYSFVLTHTRELPGDERFSAELQFYNVHVHGAEGQSLIDAFQIGQKIIITGRLDCEMHDTLTSTARPHSSPRGTQPAGSVTTYFTYTRARGGHHRRDPARSSGNEPAAK